MGERVNSTLPSSKKCRRDNCLCLTCTQILSRAFFSQWAFPSNLFFILCGAYQIFRSEQDPRKSFTASLLLSTLVQVIRYFQSQGKEEQNSTQCPTSRGSVPGCLTKDTESLQDLKPPSQTSPTNIQKCEKPQE